MHTPGFPVSRPWQAAMKPAPCSWRVTTTSMDDSRRASSRSRFSSPGTAKILSTPSASRHSTINRDAFRSLMTFSSFVPDQQCNGCRPGAAFNWTGAETSCTDAGFMAGLSDDRCKNGRIPRAISSGPDPRRVLGTASFHPDPGLRRRSADDRRVATRRRSVAGVAGRAADFPVRQPGRISRPPLRDAPPAPGPRDDLRASYAAAPSILYPRGDEVRRQRRFPRRAVSADADDVLRNRVRASGRVAADLAVLDQRRLAVRDDRDRLLRKLRDPALRLSPGRGFLDHEASGRQANAPAAPGPPRSGDHAEGKFQHHLADLRRGFRNTGRERESGPGFRSVVDRLPKGGFVMRDAELAHRALQPADHGARIERIVGDPGAVEVQQ